MSKKPKTTSFVDFLDCGMEVYEAAQAAYGARAGQRSPIPADVIAEIRRIPEIVGMQEAARLNCPSAFSMLLQTFLATVGIEPPGGVFQKVRHGKPGRIEDPESARIYMLWVQVGGSISKLAKAYYGDRYKAAEVEERNQMVDRLRKSVERFKERREREKRD